MWKSLQGATVNIANRATRLAADVLETASEEVTGAHEYRQNTRPSSDESTGSSANPRLAALRARYKANHAHPSEDRESKNSDGGDGSPYKGENGAYRAPPRANIREPLSSEEERSECAKLRNQLGRLKAELVQQTIRMEDEAKQREFDAKEQLKVQEHRHKQELEQVRMNSQTAVDSSQQSHDKDEEIQMLKQKLGNLQQHNLNQAFNSEPIETANGPAEELEFLRAQLAERSMGELNADSLEDLIFAKDEEIEKLEVQLDAYRVSDPEINRAKLQEENEILRSELEALKEGINFQTADHTVDTRKETESLLQRIDELTIECENLKKLSTSKDQDGSFIQGESAWTQELEQERARLSEAQWHIQQMMEKEKVQSDQLVSAQSSLEEIQLSLEDRDRIWQDELVKSQQELQAAKREIEELKLWSQANMYNDTSAKESQVEVLKQANAHLTEQRETAQQHLQNEKELRAGAEKHVKGLQKSLESNLADSEFKLDSLQKELESQKMALIASEQNLQAAWKQVTEGKDKHLSLEKEKSGWETSLASARREIANLNQELEGLRAQGNAQPFPTSQDGAAIEALRDQLADSHRDNESLRSELDGLRQQVSIGEERLQVALEQQNNSMPAPDQEAGAIQIMQTRVTEMELERNRLKEQLNRLKTQMLSIQEDQEGSIGWRIDAEVKLALRGLQEKEEEAKQKLVDRISDLENQLQNQGGNEKSLHEACTEKDKEILNLQSVLGELTFHGEAAEKLRKEVRKANQEIDQLREELRNANSEIAVAHSSKKAAEASADRANKLVSTIKEQEDARENELVKLKRALLESTSRVSNLNEGADSMVDRRVVVKLLVTYVERRNSREVLQLMAKLLKFTDEEKQRVGLDRPRRGIAGAITGGTMAIVRGGMTVATLGLLSGTGKDAKPGDSLADRWVEFLMREAEVDVQVRKDFRQDPLEFLKEKDPFESGAAQQVKVPSPRPQEVQNTGVRLQTESAGPSAYPKPASTHSMPGSPFRYPQSPGYPRQSSAFQSTLPQTNAFQPSIGMPKMHQTTMGNSSVKSGGSNGSLPSLRDYMAKYHPGN